MESLLDKIYYIDHAILLFIQENCRCEFLTPIMELSSFLVNIGFIWIFVGAALVLRKKTRIIGIAVLSSLLFSLIINNVIIKNLFARARPFDTFDDILPLIKAPTDYSFASGHTTASFAASVILARCTDKRFGVLAIAFSCLVGFSRLYLGVHYPTDVLCGMIIGTLGSLIIYKLYSKKYDMKILCRY